MKARRWSDTAAFRADPAAAQVARPSRRQTIALLVVLALIAGAVVAASYLVRPEKARAFDLAHGSVFLEDTYAPVGIDLATGKPTVRLADAVKQVGATRNNQLSVVPLDHATLLLNNGSDNANSGEFNEVDDTGFVTKPDGSGVPISKRSDQPESLGFADTGPHQAPGSAYIERTGPAGTDVFLVNEATVQAASGNASAVKPRASVSFDDKGLTRTGAGASANGGLWLLVGAEDHPVLQQLSVPANSNSGARLTTKSRGTVNSAAAIGVANSVDSDSTDVVGVAQPGSITLYPPDGPKTNVSIDSGAGVRTILPATNQEDRLAFLERAGDGWWAVSVRSDGTGKQSAPLPGIPAGDDLAQPTHSGDALYTLDKSSGQIYAIRLENNTARLTAIAPYPKQTGEAAGLADAYLVGRGPRVIVNSPGHAEALVIFTDGVRAPLAVRKSQAVTINAAANATTFTQDKVDQTNQQPKATSGGTAPARSQPISTRVDCATVNQKPHIPTITTATPSSRSVALAWTYPLLDQQDCAPSTYVVKVKLLSNDAPKPDGSATVQGQQSVNLSGLYPSTRYQVTVTAYLNKLSTESSPVTFTTGLEGPAAPTGVSASADSAGNWTVTWQGCGTVAQGCVPAASWRVIPTFCDGVGLSGTPTVLNVPADPTTKAQTPAVYKGGDNLLGRGLSFQIQGTGEQGQAGTLSAKSACVYSWTAPNAGAMTLHASSPDNTALGGASSTNVTLNLGANPTRDVGGYGAKIALTLSGDGTSQTKTFTFTGNQTVIGANFGGVHSGALYTASATITSAHGGGSGSVSPVTVQTRANWPATSLSAGCASSGLLTCTLTVNIHGISSADARGEKFSFDGLLVCGNANHTVSASGFDPANPITVTGIDQDQGLYGNGCKVSGTLRESSNATPLVFGGSTTTPTPAVVDLPGPTHLNASTSDFNAKWDGNSVDISYTGGGNLDALTTGWSEAVQAPGGSTCGSASSQPPAAVPVDTTCIQAHGGDDGWQATVTYTDKIGGGGAHSFTLTGFGKPPNYVPPVCSPNLSAAWGNTQADGVVVSNTGKIDNCTNWGYSLVDTDGNTVCADATATGAPPVTVHYTSCGTPPDGSWQVKVTFQDVNNQTQTTQLNIPGNPPES